MKINIEIRPTNESWLSAFHLGCHSRGLNKGTEGSTLLAKTLSLANCVFNCRTLVLKSLVWAWVRFHIISGFRNISKASRMRLVNLWTDTRSYSFEGVKFTKSSRETSLHTSSQSTLDLDMMVNLQTLNSLLDNKRFYVCESQELLGSLLDYSINSSKNLNIRNMV